MPVRRSFAKWKPVFMNLQSGIKIGVGRGFTIAQSLVPVHVEWSTLECINNVNIAIFNPMYNKGTTIPYIDYVAYDL